MVNEALVSHDLPSPSRPVGMPRLREEALIINFRFRIFRNPRIFPIFPKSALLNPFFRFLPFFPKFIDHFFISLS
ncbi:MAG: hypothetical protein CRN43_00760 [Candidatus Nephrothrix sp. EaCA]|nr:MAG: hypothetical protein CRN43_00760 [Candidatus Nephrothrix sp. EaCA]